MRYQRTTPVVPVFLGVAALALATFGAAFGQEGEGASEDILLDSLLNVTVSSASKYSQTATEAPASVTVISAEEIRLFGYRTIEDVLTSVPGFYMSNDRNYGRLGARGFGRPGDYNSRILLLVNGVVMNDATFGSAYVGTEFPFALSSVERIEIVRGPASAMYGTGAMFGVVNLILRNGETMEGVHLATEAGNIGQVRGSATGGTNWGSGWSLLVSGQLHQTRGEDLYFSEFDTPETNGGMVRGLDRDRSASVLGQLRFKQFKVVGGMSSRRKTVPTASWGAVFNDPRLQTTDECRFLGLSGETALSTATTLSARVSTGDVDYAGQYPYEMMNYDASCGLWWGAEALLHSDFPFGGRLTIGSEFRRFPRLRYQSWTEEEVIFDKEVSSSSYSGFAEGEFPVFNTLTLVAGLRFDDHSIFDPSWSPRFALVYSPSGTTTLKVLYGSAYRVPNFSEVYYEDPVSGHKVNPLVHPERIQTIEALWDQRIAGSLSASVSVHRYTMSDLIDIDVDPVDSLTFYRNRGDVRATGMELQLVTLARSGLRGRVSYCYEYTEDLTTQSVLTNSPAHIFRVSLGAPLTSWLTASGFIKYESKRLSLNGTWTPGFWISDLTIAVRPSSLPVQLEASVRNLFDVRYALPAASEHRQSAIPQWGRIWYAGVSFDF